MKQVIGIDIKNPKLKSQCDIENNSLKEFYEKLSKIFMIDQEEYLISYEFKIKIIWKSKNIL